MYPCILAFTSFYSCILYPMQPCIPASCFVNFPASCIRYLLFCILVQSFNELEFLDNLELCIRFCLASTLKLYMFFSIGINKQSGNSYVIAGQIFTLEGIVDKSLDHHTSLLAWTGLWKAIAPNCQCDTLYRSGRLKISMIESQPSFCTRLNFRNECYCFDL